MTNWILDLDLVKHGPIVQLDEQCIPDRAPFRIVVLNAEALVLYAINLRTEWVDPWVSGRFVRAVESGTL